MILYLLVVIIIYSIIIYLIHNINLSSKINIEKFSNKNDDLISNLTVNHDIIKKEQIINKTGNKECIIELDNNSKKILGHPLFSMLNDGKNICYSNVNEISNNLDCCPNQTLVNNNVVCRKDFSNLTEKEINDWSNKCLTQNVTSENNIHNLKDEINYKESLIHSLNNKIHDLNNTNKEQIKNNKNIESEKIKLNNEILLLKQELESNKQNIESLETRSVGFIDGMDGYRKFNDATLSTKYKYILGVEKNIDNPKDCSLICNKNSNCQSFSWNKSQEKCKFYNVNSDTIPINIYGNNRGTVEYYEKNHPISNYTKYTNKSLGTKTEETFKTEFPIDCSNLCNSREYCNSFDYNKITKECNLKSKSTIDLNINDNFDHYKIINKLTLSPSSENLIAWWKLNEGFGNRTYDSTGNSIHGEIINGKFIKINKENNGYSNLIDFNGESTMIVLPGNKNLDLKKMTISLKIKCRDVERFGYLFEKTTNSYVNSQYSIFISKVNDESHLIFRTNPQQDNSVKIIDWSNEDLSIPVKNNLKNNEWNNIAVTYDGKFKRIYINGKLKGEKNYDKLLRSNPEGVSFIGCHGRPFNMFFKGLIKDIKIYKKALNEKEIQN